MTLTGFDDKGFDQRVRALLPHYMTMGTKGMTNMMDMEMALPQNSIPMAKGRGGFNAAISLGGMAGVLKVRNDIEDLDQDPGWYDHAAGTRAQKATADQIKRDGI